uniref:Uncharacterized protein n=1 Tax=Malurus cyaneus samueli TaxID=2593467 RepID=A0A8C5UA77_9PASS
MSSLQFHFLQTLEHRTDVSVTSTSPWWEAPEEQGIRDKLKMTHHRPCITWEENLVNTARCT